MWRRWQAQGGSGTAPSWSGEAVRWPRATLGSIDASEMCHGASFEARERLRHCALISALWIVDRYRQRCKGRQTATTGAGEGITVMIGAYGMRMVLWAQAAARGAVVRLSSASLFEHAILAVARRRRREWSASDEVRKARGGFLATEREFRLPPHFQRCRRL